MPSRSASAHEVPGAIAGYPPTSASVTGGGRGNYQRLENIAWALQSNSSTRCGLPSDCDKWMLYAELTVQKNLAPDAKDHRTRATGLHRRPQTAGPGIIEVGDLNHNAAAAADGLRPATLGARKSRHRSTHRCGRKKRRRN